MTEKVLAIEVKKHIAKAKTKYPCNVHLQVMVIGNSLKWFPGALVLTTLEAEQLAKRVEVLPVGRVP